MKNKKAFTLVELMGVITVIGLISLLIAPTIINQIRNSKGQLDKVTEKLIYSAAELYLDTKQNEYPKNNGSVYCLTIEELVNDGKLSSPVLDSNGEEISLDKIIAVDVVSNNYNYRMPSTCENKITVGEIVLSNSKVTIDIGSTVTVTASTSPSDASNNALTWTSSDEGIVTVENGIITGVAAGTTTITVSTTDGSNISKTISVSVVTPIQTPSETPIMTSTNNCINSTSTVCPNGTEVTVAVNETETYTFYVIKDTGSELTLIMNQNLGDKVAWILQTDYTNVGGNNWDSSYGANDKGPRTAVAALKERTAGWINIPARSYTYSDDGGGNMYASFTETMRARMLTYAEATELGCLTNSNRSCPSYLYVNNEKYGYWTSAAYSEIATHAWYISYDGWIDKVSSNSDYIIAIRPVITLSK